MNRFKKYKKINIANKKKSLKKRLSKKLLMKRSKKYIGGSKNLSGVLQEKYNELAGKNFMYDTIESCIQKNVNLSDAGEKAETIKIIHYFFDKLISNNISNDYVDLYSGMPIRFFLVNYMNFKLSGKKSNIIRGNKFKPVHNDVNNILQKMNNNTSSNQKNKIPVFRNELVSTNLSILGNTYDTTISGESTLNYYLRKSCQLNFSIKDVIKNFLFSNYPLLEVKYIDEVIKILSKLEKTCESVIIQYLFLKSECYKYIYLSKPFGIKIFDSNNNKNFWKSNTNEKYELLKGDSSSMHSEDKGKDICDLLMSIQARIVFSKFTKANLDKMKVTKQLFDFNFYPPLNTSISTKIDTLISEMINDKDKSAKDLYSKPIKYLKSVTKDNKDAIIDSLFDKKNKDAKKIFESIYVKKGVSNAPNIYGIDRGKITLLSEAYKDKSITVLKAELKKIGMNLDEELKDLEDQHYTGIIILLGDYAENNKNKIHYLFLNQEVTETGIKIPDFDFLSVVFQQ